MLDALRPLWLLLLLAPPVQAAGPPARVVSINLCTDQLLLMLASPKQIASVSQLALEPNSSYMAEQAKQYPTNNGRAEELLALKPDLILASQYTDPALVKLLRKLKLRVETFPQAATTDDIRRSITRMAKLLDRDKQGNTLLKQMNQRLEKIIKSPPAKRPRAAFYQPNGYTSGSGTLQDIALQMAGWDNIASKLGVKGYGSIDLERLLMAHPEQLFSSAYAPGTHSLAQKELQHPALQRITNGRAIINISYKYWICGGPMIADAVERLHQSLPR